jgi:hypothetical protein
MLTFLMELAHAKASALGIDIAAAPPEERDRFIRELQDLVGALARNGEIDLLDLRRLTPDGTVELEADVSAWLSERGDVERDEQGQYHATHEGATAVELAANEMRRRLGFSVDTHEQEDE